ncbi:MAG: hypothetical protein AAB455_02870 [Patescibacteria group bacterium]
MLRKLDHHAYLLVGDRTRLLAEVRGVIDQFVDSESLWLERESFGIDDSRAVIERQAGTAWQVGKKFFVIAADAITLPAQHALLKVLEEPTTGTHFFLISSSLNDLLPTLRSRCQLVHMAASESVGEQTEASVWVKRWLEEPPVRRLELVRQLVEEEVALKHWLALAQALEIYFHDRLLAKRSPEVVAALTELKQALNYLQGPAALPRLIFEHLALVLPAWPKGEK